jgi:hypothetical protein
VEQEPELAQEVEVAPERVQAPTNSMEMVAEQKSMSEIRHAFFIISV